MVVKQVSEPVAQPTFERVFFAATNAQAVDHLRRVLSPGSYVLIKGSHGVHMEEVVEGLRAK